MSEVGEAIDIFDEHVVGTDENVWRLADDRYRFRLNTKHLSALVIWEKMSEEERKKKYMMQGIDMLEKLQQRDVPEFFGFYVHTDREDILRVLASYPYESAHAFDLLEFSSPEEILDAAHRKAVEDMTDLFKKFEEGNTSYLLNRLEYIRKHNVTDFVEEFELHPGVIINSEQFVSGLEKRFRKQEEQIKSKA